MPDRKLNWVMPIMRAGYGARGLVYAVVGGIAVWSAWTGGSAEGTTTALATLRGAPVGQGLLWAMALGLFAYAVWRALDAALDLEDHGTDAEGWASRVGLMATGLIHAALGLSVLSLATGGASGGGDTQGLVARVMQMDGGRWIVAALGVAVIGAGVYYAHKGIARKYKQDIRNTAATERLEPVLRFGLIAQGAVIGIIGVLIGYAAWTLDATQAGGLGAAFEQVRQAPFGRILLVAIALGLVAFAVENFVEAVYRVVPRLRDPDTKTMAMQAEAEAARVKAHAKDQARRATG